MQATILNGPFHTHDVIESKPKLSTINFLDFSGATGNHNF